MKRNIVFMILGMIIIAGISFGVYAINAGEITYRETTVDQALDDLYENSFKINLGNLKMIKGISRIPVTVGKKYLIAINVTSHATQNYIPSIVSGCDILKENQLISTVYDTLATNMKSYIVEATGSEIVLSGNPYSNEWDHIVYYEF